MRVKFLVIFFIVLLAFICICSSADATRAYISGYVKSTTFNAYIAGTSVILMDNDLNTIVQTTTNATGYYNFYSDSLVNGNTYWLKTNNPRFYYHQQSISFTSEFTLINGAYYNTYPQNINLNDKTVIFNIYSRDENTYNEIYPVRFYIYEYYSNNNEKPISTITSNYGGSVVVQLPMYGYFTITATVPTYFNKTLQNYEAATTDQYVYFNMESISTYKFNIYGDTFDHDNFSISLANTHVEWFYPNGTLMLDTYSDSDYMYSLTSSYNIPSGNYSVKASHDGYNDRILYFDIPSFFVDYGTLINDVYYMNLYLFLYPTTVTTGNLYFTIQDSDNNNIDNGNVFITDSQSSTLSCNINNGISGFTYIPYDDYHYSIVVNGFDTITGDFTLNSESSNTNLQIKLNTESIIPTPTINPSISPDSTPNAIGYGEYNWGSFVQFFLTSFGVPLSIQPFICGLILIMICSSIGALISKNSIPIIGISGFLGLICCVTLGLIDIWVIVVIVIIAFGLILLNLKGRDGSSGDEE